MTKLHLPARPANEGARRLAWTIMTDHGGDVAAFARKMDVLVTTIDRIVSGELLPAAEMANRVYLATGGAVWRWDWRRPAQAGWFTRPIARERTRAAA